MSAEVPSLTRSLPDVSVVLATFNGAKYLKEQLDSLARQSLPPAELIISDDASTDESVEIARRFARQTTFPVLVNKNETRLGFADNFLHGCSLANGDVIAFCDQDDIWRPQKIDVCAKELAAHPNAVLVAHAAELIDGNGNRLGRFDHGIHSKRVRPPLTCRPYDVYNGFTMVFRRSLLKQLPSHERGLDFVTGKHRLAHDRWVRFLALSLGEIVELEEELVQYRQHGNNLFGGGDGKAPKMLHSLRQYFPDKKEYVENSGRILSAARNFRELMERIPKDAEKEFPLFDRRAAMNYWSSVERQASTRYDIQRSSSRLAALWAIGKGLGRGSYVNAYDRKLNIKACGLDFLRAIVQ